MVEGKADEITVSAPNERVDLEALKATKARRERAATFSHQSGRSFDIAAHFPSSKSNKATSPGFMEPLQWPKLRLSRRPFKPKNGLNGPPVPTRPLLLDRRGGAINVFRAVHDGSPSGAASDR